MPLSKRLTAEFLGTLWLVLGGCGTAVLAGAQAGNTGISLAFGLTVLTGAYALGHISGAHFNPAVTVGLWAGKRFPGNEILPYVIAQVLGAIAGAGILYIIASQKAGFSLATGFASNGFGDHSPGKYYALAAFVAEVVMTFFFLIVILGVTQKEKTARFAPLAIGFALTLIHLISIPVTNTSVNPARSTGPAVFAQGWALTELWMFWVAPLLGGLLAGFFYDWLGNPAEAAPAADPGTESGPAPPKSDNEDDAAGDSE
jgi:aquaporin Z